MVLFLVSACSGGTNYTVTGQNLDIVQEPRLIVYVSAPQNVAKRQAQGSQEVELLSVSSQCDYNN